MNLRAFIYFTCLSSSRSSVAEVLPSVVGFFPVVGMLPVAWMLHIIGFIPVDGVVSDDVVMHIFDWYQKDYGCIAF